MVIDIYKTDRMMMMMIIMMMMQVFKIPGPGPNTPGRSKTGRTVSDSRMKAGVNILIKRFGRKMGVWKRKKA